MSLGEPAFDPTSLKRLPSVDCTTRDMLCPTPTTCAAYGCQVESRSKVRLGPCQLHARETEKEEAESVNHPAHYTQGSVECIDALKAATAGKSGIEALCVANIIKYLWRYEKKGGRQDVEKAKWYLERLLKEIK